MPETVLTAERRTWKEWRDGQWGEKIHNGVYFTLCGKPLLVSRQPHGLRVMVAEEAKFRFESKGPSVEVTSTFLLEANSFLLADQRFQSQVENEFDSIMST